MMLAASARRKLDGWVGHQILVQPWPLFSYGEKCLSSEFDPERSLGLLGWMKVKQIAWLTFKFPADFFQGLKSDATHFT